MKKIFLLLGMAAAMVNFAGCQKNEIEDPNANADGSSFELVAEIAQTKTTLDGLSVEWEEGDVLYLVTADGTWGAPFADDRDAATIAEYAYNDGKFTTGSTISDGEYTFNAMYARANQKSYHRGASTTHKLEATQSQDCANPTAHIKENDALVGTFTATTPMTEAAQVTMSHIYTMMQVDVKNNTGAEIEVATFEMTAEGADLAGVFNVESFETPSISTKSGASSTITVNVTNGTVAAGESLPVYFVMAPLSNYSGDVTFKVTDAESKTYTKTVTLNGISFEAGKYNTTPYTISSADVVEPEPENVTWDLSIDETSEVSATKIAWTSDFAEMYCEKGDAGTATNNYYGGNSDNRTSTRFYKNSVLTIASKTGYKITSVVFTATSEGYAAALSSRTSTWTNASAEASGKTVIVTPTDGTQPMTATIGDTCGFTSVVVYYAENEGGETPEPETPELAVDPATVKVAAAGGYAEFGYTVTNPTEGVSVSASTEANWISGFVYSTANKVSFTVAENTATEAREAVITLSYTGAESKTVTVKQDAKVPEGMKVDVLTRATTGVEGTTYTDWSGKTVTTSSAVYAGQSAGEHDAIQLRSKNSNSGIVTTKSGGYVKKVVVTWNSNTLNGRTLNVYGKNSAYSTATELYDSNTQGTLLGTIVYGTSTELEVTGNYQYIGLRSADAAMYLDEIKITWSSEASDAPVVPELAVNPATVEVAAAGGNAEFGYTIINPADGVSVSASTEANWISGFSYSNANKVTFTVAENTATEAREAVITLAYEGAASKTITVKQDAAESDPGTGGGATISKTIADIATANSWVNSKQYKTINLNEVITATVTGGGNTGKYYTSGNNWRIYQNETPSLTISASQGYTIESVKITYNVEKRGVLTYNSSNVTSGTKVDVNASSITFGVGNTGTATDGQVRVTAIEVVYHQAN